MDNIKREKAQKLFEDLRSEEKKRTCGVEASKIYQQMHQYRFEKTIEICQMLVSNPSARVLDVGPSSLTKLLAQKYRRVTTLGLEIEKDKGGQQDNTITDLEIPHIIFNLNDSPYTDKWPDVQEEFELIVYAETLEHLPIAPEYSLVFLSNLLSEEGILLMTTPNAAMIIKRLSLLIKGKNPFGQIRLYSENPGHYREYTMSELIAIAERCNLRVVYNSYINFYSPANSFYGILKNLTPAMKDSIVLAFKNKKY